MAITRDGLRVNKSSVCEIDSPLEEDDDNEDILHVRHSICANWTEVRSVN